MNHRICFPRAGGCRTLVLFTLVFIAASAREASATFRQWLGTNGVRWSSPSNWSPPAAPQAGDDVYFPNGVANLTSSNDIAGLAINSILFNAPIYLRGAALTVSNGITSSVIAVGTTTVECPIILGGDQQFYEQHRDFQFTGGIDLKANNLTFYASGDSGERIIVASAISGTGNIGKDGPGTMLWQGLPNTFTGTLRVTNGLVQFNKPFANSAVITQLEIASPGAVQLLQDDQIFNLCTVVLETGGQLLLNGHREFLTGDINMWDDAVIDSGGNYLSGGLYVLGTVKVRTTNSVAAIRNGILSLNSTTVTFDIDGVQQATSRETGHLDVSANMIGEGVGFTKTGEGLLRLSGTNSYTGVVVTMGGDLVAAHPSAFGTTAGGVEMRGGSITLTNVNIGAEPLAVIGGNGEFQDADDSGQPILGQALELQGVCSWAGPVTLNTNLFVYASVVDDMTFSGPISGSGGLSLYFANYHFSGTASNSYTGPTLARCQLLTLNKPANTLGFGIRGPLSVGGLFSFTTPAEVRWSNDLQVSSFVTLTLHTNAFVNLNGHFEGVGTVVFNGGRIDTGPSPGLMEIYQELISNPTNSTARIDGHLRLLQPRNFTVADGPVNPDLWINAIISETGRAGLNKYGLGELLLSAPNTYSGSNQVFEGILQVKNDSGLGTTTNGGTIVFDGATLQIDNVATLAEPLSIQGTGRGGTNGALYSGPGGSATIFSPITLAAPATIRSDDNSSGFFLASTISGTGPLTKTGSGFLTFGGSANNTYSGETFVNAGRLTLQKPAGITAIPSHLTIGTGLLLNSANVVQNASFLIIGSVTVNRATWNLNGSAEGFTISALEGRPPLTLLNGGNVQTGPAGIVYLPVGGNVVASPSLFGGCAISGNVGLDPGAHHFTVGIGQVFFGGPDLDVPALISQTSTAASIVKDGPGTMRLSGSNSFTGSITVNEGTLIVSNNFALGTTADLAYIRSNAVLALDGGRVIHNKALDTSSAAIGAITSLNGSNVWDSVVIFDNDTSISVGSFLLLSGQIAGSHGLTKIGAGTLQFSGSISNNYGGLTTVSEGVMEVAKVNVPAIPGDCVIGGDSTGTTAATLRSLREQQFSRAANITLHRSGLLDLAPVSGLPVPQPTIRTVPGAGKINLGVGTSLTISNDVPFDFFGALSGTGAFNKWGTAKLQLRGDSPSFTGGLNAFAGTLLVHAAMPNAPLTALNSSTVGGSGAVGHLRATNSSTVAPSPLPQTGRPSAQFSATSSDFTSTSTFAAESFLPYGVDQLYGGGVLNLGSAHLNASFGYAPTEGDVIPIVVNNTFPATPITGTFNGLPDGATFSAGGYSCVIHYNAGSLTKNVELTVTNLPLRGGGFQLLSGNLGSTLVPNDCGVLSLIVTNHSGNTITNLHATLSSLTDGVIVTADEADYPNLAPNARGTNAQSFQIRTDPAFLCGGSATLQLSLTGSNMLPTSVRYTLPGGTNCNSGGGACESCQVVNGALDDSSLTATQRLAQAGSASVCDPPKPCPGITNLPLARYRTHAFTNTAGQDVCVTVKLAPVFTVFDLRVETLAAYLGSYNPDDICANYLGDSGANAFFSISPFAFRVPAGARIEIVVTGNPTNSTCTGYTLEVFGLPCPNPAMQLAAQNGLGPLLVQWSSAYPDWHLQAANALGGAGPPPFTNAGNTPVLLNGKYTVTNAAIGPQKFFRLTK